jgi:hypothetical protein
MYEVEKKGNIGGLILLFVCLTLAGTALSYIYVGLMDVVMHIWLNPLMTLLFGMLLAALVNLMKKGFKITSRVGAFFVVLVSLVIVFYFMWNMFFGMWYARSEWRVNPFLDMGDFFEAFIWSITYNPANPIGEFVSDFRVFNYYGTWSYNDNMITGIPLAVLWVIETVVVYGLPLLAASASVGFFLHEKNAWATPVYYEGYYFRALDKDTLDRLQEGTEDLMTALSAAHLKPEDVHAGEVVTLAAMNHGEEKTDYVAIMRIDKTKDEDKKGALNAIFNMATGGNFLIRAFKLPAEKRATLDGELEKAFGTPFIVEEEAENLANESDVSYDEDGDDTDD